MHELHKIPDDWTLTDQSEVCNIVEQLLLHIDDESASPLVKKLFKEKFHSTWENFSLAK